MTQVALIAFGLLPITAIVGYYVGYYVGNTVGWVEGYRRCRKTTEEAIDAVFGKR